MERKTLHKQEPFDVPEAYFENLEKQLLHIPERKKRTSVFLKIAASVALLTSIGLGAVIFWSQPESSSTPIANNIILDEELLELDWYQLAEELPETETNNSFEDISDDDIIDYLTSENIELTEFESIF